MCGRFVWRYDRDMQEWVRHWLDDPLGGHHVAEDGSIDTGGKDPEIAPQGPGHEGAHEIGHKAVPSDALPDAVKRDRYNVAPTTDIVIATRHGIEVAPWGIPLGKKPVINARIETLEESPMWKPLLGDHQVIVPATAYYEWKDKVPHCLRRKDGKPLLMAGLRGAHGQVSIVTRLAAPGLASIHDRMPWIFDDDDAAHEWVAGAMPDAAVTELDAYAVGADVGNVANDGPGLMEPIKQWF